MSLLNDALRKKRSEEPRGDSVLNASLPKAGAKPGRKKSWVIIGSVLGVSVAVCAAWLYRVAPDGASDLSLKRPSKSIPATVAAPVLDKETNNASRNSVDKPPAGNVAAASTPVDVIPPSPTKMSMAKAVEPESPKLTNQNQPKKKVKPKTSKLVSPKPAVKTPVKSSGKKAAVKTKKRKINLAHNRQPPPKTRSVKRAKVVRKNSKHRRQQSERLYQKARQYHRQEDYKQAIALYREVVKIDPGHDKARFNMAAAYLQIQGYNKAYDILVDLYQDETHNQQVMINLAIAHIGCGRSREALTLLDKVESMPEAHSFEVAFHKGLAYSRLHMIKEALGAYKRAETMRPEDPRLLFNVAVIYDQELNYRAAIDYYRRYMDRSPKIDAYKQKQIRRRIRALQAYGMAKESS